MSETQPPSTPPSDELHREAATWFSRMRGPDADSLRPAFETWLAQGAGQRSAYNRAAEIFAMGKLLAEDAPTPPRRPARARTAVLMLCGLGALALSGWSIMHVAAPTSQAPQRAAGNDERKETFATIAGETRAIRLSDGSMLALGSDSSIAIEFDRSGRRLRLLNGKVRFEVAHEPRPFIVLAGGGSVTARGTIFEVTLAKAGRVDVRLLEGKVDVALPRLDRQPPEVRHLQPGERLTFIVSPAAAVSPAPSAPAAVAVRDYRGVPVAALVAEANRGALRPIRLADQALGNERVSGRFRIDDTALLAERLAALFGRKVELNDNSEIVLVR